MTFNPNKYPDDISQFEDIDGVINQLIASNVEHAEPFLTKESNVVTLGSCFANNISKALSLEGYKSFNAEIPEMVNTTFGTKAVVEAACSEELELETAIYAGRVLQLRNGSIEETKNRINEADVFIITIGVAWIPVDEKTMAWKPSLKKGERFSMRLSSQEENVSNVRRVIHLIRSVRPNCKIILTVSPVPGTRGYAGAAKSPFVADCLSKSVMRMTAHVVCSQLRDQVIYWPSFEMVRWLGGHTGPVFGQSDGNARHPNDELVQIIMKSFISTFSTRPSTS
jgi:hypothetical protein